MDKSYGQIENQLRVVMLERMLQEKYGKIEYLAIQPMPDPTITQINNEDLAYLLRERDRCEELEEHIRDMEKKMKMQAESGKEKYENLLTEYHEVQREYHEVQHNYHEVQHDYQCVLDSRTWRWGKKISGICGKLLSPIRKLKHVFVGR